MSDDILQSFAENYLFSTADVTTPQGENALASFALFYWRWLYQQNDLAPGPGGLANYDTLGRSSVYYHNPEIRVAQDTWYDKILFGRVDRVQNAISIKPEKLTSFGHPNVSEKPDLVAADFVVEAFTKFVAHMQQAQILGRVDTAGNKRLIRPRAVTAYIDPLPAYTRMHDGALGAYIRHFSPRQQSAVTNFKTFVADYCDYLSDLAQYYPITKGNFILSSNVSPFASALRISLFHGDAGSDSQKATDWINDPNFAFYTRAAKKFGFIVDKNMPWMLTADLFSDAIKVHFPSGVTEDNFFTEYYNNCYLQDMEYLASILYNGYAHLIKVWPFSAKERRVCVKSGESSFRNVVSGFSYGDKSYYIDDPSLGPIVDEARRPPASPYYAEQLLTGVGMLNFYIKLRHQESGRPVRHMEQIKARARQLHAIGASPMNMWPTESLQYVNTIYRDYIYNASYLAMLYPPELKEQLSKLSEAQGDFSNSTSLLEVLSAIDNYDPYSIITS